MTNTIIRDARPEDAATIAYLMYLAGRGHVRTSVLDLLFPGEPGPTPERLEQVEGLVRAQTRSMFHYSFYRVVEVDGEVAASAGTYHKESPSIKEFVGALEETGWDRGDFEEMGERMAPFLAVNPSIPDDALIVENVATLEGFRRRGLTTALVADAISRGRREGFPRVQLSCFIGNTPAERAYRKIGFEVVDRYPSEPFEKIFGCPGMSRLVLWM
ncbi:MAG: GNAT family N-acetyltransferase [Actinobacteria bacterium]|nr:GNAT family N-acetyltransferase [Actinomycetota bacterium]